MGKDFFWNGHMGSGTRAEEVWYNLLKTHIHSIFLTKESALIYETIFSVAPQNKVIIGKMLSIHNYG